MIVRTVYVGNVAHDLQDSEILEFFERFGQVEKLSRIRDYETGKPKGYAFVKYLKPQHAGKAVTGAHCVALGKRTLVVRLAKEKPGRRSMFKKERPA